jgi:Chaperone of endosialidase
MKTLGRIRLSSGLMICLATLLLSAYAQGADKLTVKDATGTITKFVVTDTGLVGIGTPTPGGQLHIGGAANWDLFAGMGPDLSIGPAFNYGYAGATFGRSAGFFNVRPDALAIAPNPSLRFMTANVQQMIITNAGNIGIGANFSAPTNPLQFASGALVTAGGVFTNASSRSYKDHIKELSAADARTALLQLAPVTYVYKAAPGEHHVGFIAEDSPPMLTTADRKAMSPMDVAAVLTKVVQEQQQALVDLAATVTRLEAELNGLKSRDASVQR